MLEHNLGRSADALFQDLANGAVLENPFPDHFSSRVSNIVLDRFRAEGRGADPHAGDREQSIRIRLLEQILQIADDADAGGMAQFCTGVRLGVGVKMPRTPAVYERKRKWRLKEQETAGQALEEASVQSTWRDNYRSAVLHGEALTEQVNDHFERGMILRLPMNEALKRYPNLSVNSLGAVAKLGENGEVKSIRQVMDGTHGVNVNGLIKVRDRDRCPTAMDVRRVQREQAGTNAAIGLAIDIKDAHRLPLIAESDWGLQGCIVDNVPEVNLYKCGVFGISSIGYWWSRLGGAILRTVHHVMSPDDEIWMLMMADDIKLESTSRTPTTSIIMIIILFVVLGVPLSWAKIQGGHRLAWIGYEVCLSSLSLGISESRARWAVDWLHRVSRDGYTDIDDFRAALGRLTFVAGVLQWDRPFLAPMYVYVATHSYGGHCRVPIYVRLVAKYLASRIARRRMFPSAETRCTVREAFRVDAHASGDDIGVGGWAPTRGADGMIDPWLSPWFAVRLNRESSPWAYSKGQPYRAIAALEALATLLAVKFLGGHLPAAADTTLVLPGLSDNRGNRYAVATLQTTKFPLCGVLMELACVLEKMNVRLDLHWVPRESNVEADELSNLLTSRFNPDLRIEIDLPNTDWEVLPDIMRAGMEFQSENQPVSKPPKRKRRKKATLRELQPW